MVHSKLNTLSQVDSQDNQSSPVYTTHHVRAVVVAMLDLTDIQRRTSKSKRNGVFKVDFARFRNDSTHFPLLHNTQQRQLSRRETGAERMTVHVDTKIQAEDVDSLNRPNSIAA